MRLREQAQQGDCERRESRAALLSQAGALLSWTSERQRARKAAANERQPQRAERAIDTARLREQVQRGPSSP